jgi:hypothetical protein
MVTVTKAGTPLLAINDYLDDTVPGHYLGVVTVKWTVSHQP